MNPYIPCTVPTWAVFTGKNGADVRQVVAWYLNKPCVLGQRGLIIIGKDEKPAGHPPLLTLLDHYPNLLELKRFTEAAKGGEGDGER